MEVWFSENQNNNEEKKEGKLHAKSKTRNMSGRRAHHNALEQKRRGVIRGCFECLRNSVPSLDLEDKKLSRSGILRETARYIKTTRERVTEYQANIKELRLQNEFLSNELEFLESVPINDAPWFEDFDTFSSDSIKMDNDLCFDAAKTSAIQIGENNHFVNTVAKEFLNSTERSDDEENLDDQREYISAIAQRNIFEEEELQVDVESLAENAFPRC